MVFLCEREGGREGERERGRGRGRGRKREGEREREREKERGGEGEGEGEEERVEKKPSFCPKPVDSKQMHQHRHAAHSEYT